jgi:hypothetical protein
MSPLCAELGCTAVLQERLLEAAGEVVAVQLIE